MAELREGLLLSTLAESDGQLAITGATGWVGRTAVQELLTLLPASAFNKRVRLFASRAGSLTLSRNLSSPADSAGFKIPVHPLHSLPELAAAQPLDAVLHTAFLTRDRLDGIGHDAYVTTNRWITDQLAQALELAPKARIAVISSGAASPYDAITDPMQQLARDPYGVLKHWEETRLANLAPCLVLRIYALSGRFIRDPHRFALGEFLTTALRCEPIKIQSMAPVFRSYGHAGDITALAWHWLLGNEVAPFEPLSAVNISLDLYSLAQKISDLYSLPPVQAAIDPMAQPNHYIANPQPFLAVLGQHGLAPKNLENQLLDTAAGLLAQSLGKQE